MYTKQTGYSNLPVLYEKYSTSLSAAPEDQHPTHDTPSAAQYDASTLMGTESEHQHPTHDAIPPTSPSKQPISQECQPHGHHQEDRDDSLAESDATLKPAKPTQPQADDEEPDTSTEIDRPDQPTLPGRSMHTQNDEPVPGPQDVPTAMPGARNEPLPGAKKEPVPGAMQDAQLEPPLEDQTDQLQGTCTTNTRQCATITGQRIRCTATVCI